MSVRRAEEKSPVVLHPSIPLVPLLGIDAFVVLVARVRPSRYPYHPTGTTLVLLERTALDSFAGVDKGRNCRAMMDAQENPKPSNPQ